MTERPLSPHLSTFKWGPHMLVSILHRATGDGLAIVGLAVLLWWLGVLAYGGPAYETFAWAAGTPVGYVVLIGISWAFFNHLCSGIRHLVLDIGAGFELTANKTFSTLTPIFGLLLTAGFWAALLLL